MSESISGNTQGFDALVSSQVAVMQAAAEPVYPLDFSVGSVLRAIAEGTAWIGLWLQGLILQVLTLTRAATSQASDLDSWMADFSFVRIGGVAATGVVTFARYTATQVAVIPVGTVVTSGDGTLSFTVIANTSAATWNAGAGNYQIPIGTASAAITVQASVAGSAGNVAPGIISLLASPISGVDTVVNPAALVGGANSETDAAFRARFVVYINSLARGTLAAIDLAVSSTAGVQSYSVTANYDPNAAYDPGSFYVVVDDGTGSPSSTLLAAVDAQLALYAALGIRYSAIAPSIVTATISMSITVAAGYTLSAVEAQVQTAVAAFVNLTPVGGTLSYTLLSQAIYAVSPGITDVESLTINSGTSSLTSTNLQVIKAGTVTVT